MDITFEDLSALLLRFQVLTRIVHLNFAKVENSLHKTKSNAMQLNIIILGKEPEFKPKGIEHCIASASSTAICST